MKYAGNIEAVSLLNPDYMGFIFYEGSSRFVEKPDLSTVPSSIEKIGVFVNENTDKIIDICSKYNLFAVQLHGNESSGDCKKVKDSGLTVIKAFSIDKSIDTNSYSGIVDFFLFDTKGKNYGGTGRKFDWKILEQYDGETPFFLSGGITVDDAATIMEIQHPCLYGIDINSGFETEPARKDPDKLRNFINKIRQI